MTNTEESAEYRWAGDRVARWLALAERTDRQLAPVSDVLFAAAALESGERVLDVGCGHGPTTRRAANAVGPYGRVIGLDVASAMVDAAAEIEAPSQGATIDWVAADVTGWASPYPNDAVISRFGVMFFDDPTAAFTSMAEATAPGGRLCVAVWGRLETSPIFDVPYRAARSVLDELGLAYDDVPSTGGPYSLADREATTELLTAAGWTDVGWAPHDLELPIGGGASPDEVAPASLDLGPARVLAPEDPAVRARIVEAVADAYRGHVDRDGHVVLGGHVIVITARRA